MNLFDVRWENFRAFPDTGWLKIRPITVIIGSNNSGKTSLHAPLLLLKQTLASNDQSLALLSKGELFNAGAFDDFVHNHRKSKRVKLSIAFHTHRRSRPEERKPVGAHPPGAVELEFARGVDPTRPVLTKFSVEDIYRRPYLSRSLLASGRYSLNGLAKIAPKEAKTNNPAFDKRLRRAISQADPDHFLFSPSPIFRSALVGPKEVRAVEIEVSKFAGLYLSIMEFVASQIRKQLDDISYIGPIRERPRRLYEVSGEPPADVGSTGLNAPEIIFRNTDKKLLGYVNDWIRKFEIGTSLRCVPLGDGAAFALELERSGAPAVNIADVGFGLSQVLPFIVQGHVARQRGMIIAEQPEIHLNPRLQAVLADLFCDIAKSGRGVLIETHSEHLLLRLRTLIATGEVRHDQVAIYYVERTKNVSRIRPVPIMKSGHIDPADWPSGFFEDSLKEAMALALAQRKRRSDVG